MKIPERYREFVIAGGIILAAGILTMLISSSLFVGVWLMMVSSAVLLLFRFFDRFKPVIVLLLIISGVTLPVFNIAPETRMVLILTLLMFGVIAAVQIGVPAYLASDRRGQNIHSANSPLFESIGFEFQLMLAGKDGGDFHSANIAVLPSYVKLTANLGLTAFSFNPDHVRWMGYSQNTLTLDLNVDGTWYTLQLSDQKQEIKRLVNAMQQMDNSSKLKVSKRPNVRSSPVDARPAIQDLYGVWTLGEPVTLYLTPLYLVLIQDGYVQREIAIGSIENVTEVERADEPDAARLLRFDTGDESLAFAIEQHQLFADKLAEAARRSLEEPLLRKQKGYDEEWE